ncbi:hypothetical protein WALSEDRAFT_29725 [Wallemia mellicola CBS 633.66]|uniref:Uncharacterized protein n=1 Tax=Wallemia mellicola (strain ATCC MYA-4683 / CBS 633.66) TaxID=671144 RepID=I4Y8W0_WALMC|nr:hypothetical protein WALSEDRAFT_29725 [Wallemia mellicola CBS 633.66]EIM20402.1 hypothetical protein WALSEDRAFT_29725 [Wallemia mellicola CBS 633.66]|eukprot:XP_006959658.1 hypothetical protein WALSEDRAFT_29725 [Wallemia mellicola CBS 633.66]
MDSNNDIIQQPDTSNPDPQTYKNQVYKMEDMKSPGDYVLKPGLRGLGMVRVAKNISQKTTVDRIRESGKPYRKLPNIGSNVRGASLIITLIGVVFSCFVSIVSATDNTSPFPVKVLGNSKNYFQAQDTSSSHYGAKSFSDPWFLEENPERLDLSKTLTGLVKFTRNQTTDKRQVQEPATEIDGYVWPPESGYIDPQDSEAMLNRIWGNDRVWVDPSAKWSWTWGTVTFTIENTNMDTDGCDGGLVITGTQLWDYLWRLHTGGATQGLNCAVSYIHPNIGTTLRASGTTLPSYSEACDGMDIELEGPPQVETPPLYGWINHPPGSWGYHDEL